MEEYQEYMEANGYATQQQKPSMFKRIMSGMVGEIKQGSMAIRRKRAEIANQNKQIRLKRRLKYPNRDYNIIHAHERCKIGW